MRHRLWIALAAVILCGFVIAALYLAKRNRHPGDVATIERGFRRQFPIGTTKASIEEYLDSHGIPHSYVGPSDRHAEDTNAELALVRGAAGSTWLVRGDVQMLFKFDERGKLRELTFREIFTGP